MINKFKKKWLREKSPEEKKLKKEKEKIQRDINDRGLQKVVKPAVIVFATVMLASLNNLPKSSESYYLFEAYLQLLFGSLIGLGGLAFVQVTICEKSNWNRLIPASFFIALFIFTFIFYFYGAYPLLLKHRDTLPMPEKILRTTN